MENYTTQMDAARKGIITPQMKIVAEKRTYGCRGAQGFSCKGTGCHLC